MNGLKNLKMNKALTFFIILSCKLSALSQVDSCGCDCNIVEIFTDNTVWRPKLDADQDSFYQDGSGAGLDTNDRDPCVPLTNVGTCDQDGDGYINSVDNCNFFYNTDQANNDADSYGDACDNCDLVDNEDQLNSDSDNLGDACDNCPNNTNEDQTNSDADTLGDACDNCPNLDNEGQEDGDGDDVGDICDNCLTVINTLQTNSDADTLGNACDNCDLIDNNDQVNDDGDSHGNACDNCPNDTNEDQADTDSDTVGDACDNCIDSTNVSQTNSDGDTYGDACDNCDDDTNENQNDYDSDGLGDVCDGDDDNDGVLDTVDCDSLDADIDYAPFDACDDGISSTVDDEINSSCICEGCQKATWGTCDNSGTFASYGNVLSVSFSNGALSRSTSVKVRFKGNNGTPLHYIRSSNGSVLKTIDISNFNYQTYTVTVPSGATGIQIYGDPCSCHPSFGYTLDCVYNSECP